MECHLAKTARFGELLFQENLMVVAWFLTTFPSTKSNQRPAMDPWILSRQKNFEGTFPPQCCDSSHPGCLGSRPWRMMGTTMMGKSEGHQ